jgi:hypothetical protein
MGRSLADREPHIQNQRSDGAQDMSEITVTSSPAGVASEAGRGALPPGPDPSPPSTDQADLQQIDWRWILRVLRIVRDRAQSGTPLHVTRPAWLQPEADVKALLRGGVVGLVDEIFVTAVVDEPE